MSTLHPQRSTIQLKPLFSGSPLTVATPGALCAALSPDGNFYRGQIREVNANNTVLINYIDYGNNDLLPLANLKQLNDAHLKLCAFAMKAYLAIDCNDTVDAAQLHDKVVNSTKGYLLVTNIIDCYNGHFIVDVKNRDTSLSEYLQKIGLAKALSLDMVRSLIDADIERQKNPVRIQPVVVQPPVVQTPVTNVAAPPSQMSVQPAAAVENPVSDVVAPPSQSTAQPPAHLNLTPAYISHADQPDRFYLQLEAISDELERFQQNLEIVAPSLPPLTEFRAGVTCVAKYSVDDQWYRGRIIDTDGEITSIQFIDYGNTDTITDHSLLKTSNDSFNAFPPYAVPCSMALVPTARDWSESACQKMQEILPSLIHFEVISESSERHYVKLMLGERDIAKELIESGEATALDIIKSGEKCYVSHSNSIEDFYIQMEASTKGLDLMEQYLTEAAKLEPLKNIQPGAMCAALFSDDNCYYRARVLNQKAGCIEVMFIDFGNTSLTSDVRTLPTDIAELPHMARKCSLKMSEAIQSWTDEAEERFKEICATGATTFTVRLVKVTKQITVIELYIDNSNVGNQLAVFCPARPLIEHSLDESDVTVVKNLATSSRQSAFVTHVNSPQSFYIQLGSQTNEYNQMIDKLTAASTFAEVLAKSVKNDEIYAGLFEEDETYYRCQVIQTSDAGYKVIFIDFGNEAVTRDLRVLPDSIKAIAPIAIHCRLEPKTDAWNGQQVKTFTDLTSTDSTFHIETVNASGSPQVIRLYHADANVADICQPPCNVSSDVLDVTVTEPSKTIAQPKRHKAFVTHVNSPQSFYVQLEKQNAAVDQMMDYMAGARNYNLVDRKDVSRDGIYAGLFPDDGLFYRCKVISVQPDGFNVHFIDYGNEATTQDLRSLPDDVTSIGTLAFHCQLGDESKTWSSQHIKMFNDLTSLEEASFEVEVEDVTCSPRKIKLFHSGGNIIDLCQPSPAPASTQISKPVIEASPLSTAIPSGRENVFITHVNSPQSFFVQLEKQSVQIDEMLDRMTGASGFDRVNPKYLTQDGIYAGLFADDGLYYRCKVISIHQAGFDVHFIDYGNDATTQDLRLLPDDVQAIEPLAINCQLGAESQTWTAQQVKTFNDLTSIEEAKFQIEMEDASCSPRKIQLFHSDVNILELCQPSAIPTTSDAIDRPVIEAMGPVQQSGRENVFITHVNSPQSFFVQLEKQSCEVNQMMDHMAVASKYTKARVMDLTPNGLYAGLFADDGVYYRCKVVKTRDTCIDVMFIDYGNEAATQDLRLLPAEIEAIPPLALHYQLGPESITWSQQQIKTFNDLTSADVTFQMEVLDASRSPPVIQIFHSDTSIIDLCQSSVNHSSSPIKSAPEVIVIEASSCPVPPLTREDVFVTHVNSPQSFFVQLNRQTAEIDQMTDYMAAADSYQPVEQQNATNVDTYAGLFADDGLYYRCKVISVVQNGFDVHFIDFGNEATTQDLRILPDEVKAIKPLAIHCQLGDESITWDQQQIKTFNDLTSAEESTFQIEFEDASRSPQTVRLFKADTNLSDLCQSVAKIMTEIIQPAVTEKRTVPTKAIAEKAYVTHTNSPKSFFVQLDRQTDDINQLVEHLAAASAYQQLDRTAATPDETYAGLFSEDEAYYRCRVLSVHDGGFDVLFIDYGNEATTQDLRLLPADIKSIAPFAIHCQLGDETAAWNAKQLNHFNDITATEPTFLIEVVNATCSPQIVRLLQPDGNVIEALQPSPSNSPLRNENGNGIEVPLNGATTEPSQSIDPEDRINKEIATEKFKELVNGAHEQVDTPKTVSDTNKNVSQATAVSNGASSNDAQTGLHYETI